MVSKKAAAVKKSEAAPGPHRAGLVVLWLLQAALLVAELQLPVEVTLIGYFVLPAMAAAVFQPPREVLPLVAAALVSGAVSGVHFGILTTTPYLVHLAAGALVGLLALALSAVRTSLGAAAREERLRVRATLDSLLDPHVLLRAVHGKNGAITDFIYADANDAACDYNRLSRRQLIGRRLLELLPSHLGTGLLEHYRRTMESGQPLVLNGYLYPHDILEEPRYYDIRAVKVGDSLSYTWRDVTERRAVAARLAASEEQYRLLANNSSDVVMRIDEKDSIVWVSPSLEAVLGWQPADWVGRSGYSIMVDITGKERFDADKVKLARGEGIINRARVRAKDGTVHWVEFHAGPYRGNDGRINGLVASFRIVDKEVAADELLELRATTDALTGLINRRQFDNLAHRELSRALREHEKTSLLMMDIDKFKTINDTLGHDAGDEVLRRVARACAPHLREVDIFARVGGEEFAVFMPDTPIDGARRVAERLRQALGAEPVKLHGDKSVSFTVSIGVAEWSNHGEDLPGLVKRADQCLYRAKESGRNQVCA